MKFTFHLSEFLTNGIQEWSRGGTVEAMVEIVAENVLVNANRRFGNGLQDKAQEFVDGQVLLRDFEEEILDLRNQFSIGFLLFVGVEVLEFVDNGNLALSITSLASGFEGTVYVCWFACVANGFEQKGFH
ncbi:hypothetical protein MJO29_014005 [Puccinia striiformis f. sp. tritici]|nr:hypothetical protein MJO29_014005 [Puccinia striiformis f. sp. tritici]